jgi:hypothetical protein
MSEETTNDAHLELANLFTAAAADITNLQSRLREADSPTDRRALVRSVFAFVESMLFALKQEALHHPSVFSSPEIALLREESYELADDGEALIRPARLTLKRNLKFTFAAFAKAWRTRCRLELGDAGWQDFGSALKVRDRLMHPKRIADLDVSDDEVRIVNHASVWFIGTYAIALAGALGEWWKQVKAMDLAADNEALRAATQRCAAATPTEADR